MDSRTALRLAEEAFGLGFTQDQSEKLDLYVSRLKTWSARVRLISTGDRDRIWENHILDCLSIVRRLPMNGRILDLGSGAGLPGLVVAIARPALQVVLLEPARMKALFQTQIIHDLAISNARQVRDRAENLHGDSAWKGSFDGVTARAVAPLPRLWSLALPLLKPQGFLLAMKGPDALAEFPNMPADLSCEVETLILPETRRPRALVLLRGTETATDLP